jgi:voltage-gated potassium channel
VGSEVGDVSCGSQTADRFAFAPYQFFVLAISVVAILLLGISAIAAPGDEMTRLLDWADTLICSLFLVDFAVCLYAAESKWKYFFTWGWLDLLASLPVIHIARLGRLARLVRILRVLRVIKATKLISEVLLRHKRQNALLVTALALIVVLFAGSAAVLHFESVAPNGNISTAHDALWWSITTITTVGYGDFFPVTTEGRVVAVLLMITGVGSFATLAGLLASVFKED